MVPAISYAKSGDVHVAYRTIGDGPVDLVLVPGWVSHLEAHWDDPLLAHFLERLSRFSRLILFDKRGTGLSDPVPLDRLPTLEERMDDVRAVLDAVGSRTATLFGISEGGPMCALYAATYPERTSALVMSGCYAKWIRADDYPWAPTRADHDAAFAAYEQGWGTPIGFKTVAPSVANVESCRNWWARNLRQGASPGAGLALYRMNIEIDIRALLPTIHVPTLVMHRNGDRLIDVANSRYLAARIPGAKLREFDGADHLPWFGDCDAVLDEVEEFVTGARSGPGRDTTLATVLFVDIVSSTEKAVALGDARWRGLLDQFHALVARELERHRGKLVNTAGDGVFAAFDGPARAIRCACAIRDKATALGTPVRAGLHTGECEVAGDQLAGIAVHIGARVAAAAAPGQVWVSSTVKDLVAGSGTRFSEGALHALKGVPGAWRLHTVL